MDVHTKGKKKEFENEKNIREINLNI